MKAVKGQKEETKPTPQREIRDAVREIPIEKEKGSFSDVLADLEQILKDAKDGKRELPSLRSATFDAADRQGMTKSTTYDSIVLVVARSRLEAGLRERVETLHDDWMALQSMRGKRGRRRKKAGAGDGNKNNDGQGTQTIRPNATIKIKDRAWTRDELFKMFSSDTGNIVWFNMVLNDEERKRVVLWLDANFSTEKRKQFHPGLIEKANKVYGMHWTMPMVKKPRGKGEKANAKREKAYPFKSDWEDEQ